MTGHFRTRLRLPPAPAPAIPRGLFPDIRVPCHDLPDQSAIPVGPASQRAARPRYLQFRRNPARRTGRGPDPGEERVPVAGPGDARLDERRPLLHPAGGDRRGDARARRRQGAGFEAPRLPGRRLRQRRPRRAGLFRRRAQGFLQGRPVPRAAAALSLGAGHDRHDRLLRVARRRPAEERRDRGDLRRRRCGGQRCRADRQAQGLPGGGHRRRRREMSFPGRGAGL